MMDALEALTAILVLAEVAAAAVLAVLNIREVRFLDRLRPLLPTDEDLPLFDALNGRARYITFVVLWFIALTVLGAFGIQPAEFFPPIRAINGALLLGLMAGPRVIGEALRRRARYQAEAES